MTSLFEPSFRAAEIEEQQLLFLAACSLALPHSPYLLLRFHSHLDALLCYQLSHYAHPTGNWSHHRPNLCLHRFVHEHWLLLLPEAAPLLVSQTELGGARPPPVPAEFGGDPPPLAQAELGGASPLPVPAELGGAPPPLAQAEPDVTLPHAQFWQLHVPLPPPCSKAAAPSTPTQLFSRLLCAPPQLGVLGVPLQMRQKPVRWHVFAALPFAPRLLVELPLVHLPEFSSPVLCAWQLPGKMTCTWQSRDGHAGRSCATAKSELKHMLRIWGEI